MIRVLILLLICVPIAYGLIILLVLVTKGCSKLLRATFGIRTATKKRKEEKNLADFEGNLTQVLDETFSIADAYRTVCPQGRLSLRITPIRRSGELASNDCKHYREFLEIKLEAEVWTEDLLADFEKEQEYLKEIFEFSPQEKSFTYRMPIGQSIDCTILRDAIKKKMFVCLDDYEREHPTRKFIRTPNDAICHWNKKQ